jgi:hypothetical protein
MQPRRSPISNQQLKSLFLTVLFIGSVVFSAYVFPKLAIRPSKGAFPRIQYMASFEVPSSPDFYFAHSRQSELSQSIMFHDLDDSMKNAAKADIIFIGDSRLPLGLREEFLVPRANEVGVRLFSFGFGHVEKAKFGLALIKKFDLKPKIVVVVGGPFVFQDSYSVIGEQAIRMSRWDAMKRWFEAASWWNIKLRWHSVMPKIEFFDNRLHASHVHYRSSITGWWKTVLEPNRQGEIKFKPEAKNYEKYLPMATEFKQKMDEIGALLIVSVVPYNQTQTGHLPYLKEHLGVTTLLPSFKDMRLSDGSHLNRESARVYSERFWDLFIAHPDVRKRLSLDTNQ